MTAPGGRTLGSREAEGEAGGAECGRVAEVEESGGGSEVGKQGAELGFEMRAVAEDATGLGEGKFLLAEAERDDDAAGDA